VSDTGVPEKPVFQFDSLFRPEFTREPQPYYEHMRDTNPVMRTESLYADGSSVVWLAKHADIEYVLRNPERFSSVDPNRSSQGFTQIPIAVDPPEHLRYRRLLDPMFGPREMNKLEPDITQRANELIDAFIRRGECDYADEFAVPLPCTVFLHLMGFPLEDLADFVRLKEELLRGSGNSLQDPNDPIRAKARDEATERFERLIAERRRTPRDDLLTRLITSEIDGEPLSHDELMGVCHLLLIAGLDTVTDSLTCFYAFLGRNPAYRRRLVEDPAIIPAAVEEMLRYESPVTMVLPRRVTEDTELPSGCPVHAGDSIIPLLGSANTDEAAFDRPDVVDFDRQNLRHFAFGGGVHRCLGSHLARMELRISLREWHRRIPDYHVPDDVELEFATLLRQVEHLPIVFDEVVG
jgi:cytochrome P450